MQPQARLLDHRAAAGVVGGHDATALSTKGAAFSSKSSLLKRCVRSALALALTPRACAPETTQGSLKDSPACTRLAPDDLISLAHYSLLTFTKKFKPIGWVNLPLMLGR